MALFARRAQRSLRMLARLPSLLRRAGEGGDQRVLNLVRRAAAIAEQTVRFNHIHHHLWTPTPDPSTQGEGSRGVVEMEKS
jgi:hypothetical protein